MITGLSLLIAAGGLLLVGMLMARLRALDQTLQLKRHRSKQPAVCDLLNYAAVVADGVVIGKNGTLIAGLEYVGDDHASVTDMERDMVSVRVNQALARLGSGWMLHVDAVRRSVEVYSARAQSHFPDPITAAIDQERREYFERGGALYESRFVLCVSYLPPSGAVKKLSEIIYDDDAPKGDAVVAASKTLELFEHEITGLENRLSGSFKLRRLRARTEIEEDGSEVVYDELLQHLHYCVTGIDQPIRAPAVAMYLDAVIGGQELWGGVTPRIGRKYLQVVAIEGFPTESYSGILTELGELAFDYRWSTRYIFLDSWEALSHIERFRRKWKQQVIPFLAQLFNFKTNNINEDAASMVRDASAAKVGISGGSVSAGYYTANIIFFGEDREQVEAAARTAEKAINHRGLWRASSRLTRWMLGSGVCRTRRGERAAAADQHDESGGSSAGELYLDGGGKSALPVYPPGAPALAHCVTTGATPFRLNLHVRDVGNAIMLGPIGTGKSTHLAFFAAQLLRYPGMTLFVFDKGMSMYTLCKAAGALITTSAEMTTTWRFAPCNIWKHAAIGRGQRNG